MFLQRTKRRLKWFWEQSKEAWKRRVWEVKCSWERWKTSLRRPPEVASGQTRWKRRTFWVVAILVIGCVGWLIAREQGRSQPQPRPNPVALTVNGREVSHREFGRTLHGASGPQALQFLVLKKLIAQEASRRNLTVDDSELALPEGFTDPLMRESVEEDLRTRLLLRKMVLQDVSEEEKRRVYNLFREELTTYDLAVTVKERDAAASEEQVLRGLTLPTIERQFGTEVATAALSSQNGETKPPLKNGEVVFRLVSFHSSYEELKPNVEDLLVESRRLSFLHSLLAKANVTSPYLQARSAPDSARSPADAPSPSGEGPIEPPPR